MNLTTPYEGFPLDGHTFPAPGQSPTGRLPSEPPSVESEEDEPDLYDAVIEHREKFPVTDYSEAEARILADLVKRGLHLEKPQSPFPTVNEVLDTYAMIGRVIAKPFRRLWADFSPKLFNRVSERKLEKHREGIHREYEINGPEMTMLAKRGIFPDHVRAWQMPWQLRRIEDLRESVLGKFHEEEEEATEAVEDAIIGELDSLLDDLACLPWWRRIFLGKTRKMIEERQTRIWS